MNQKFHSNPKNKEDFDVIYKVKGVKEENKFIADLKTLEQFTDKIDNNLNPKMKFINEIESEIINKNKVKKKENKQKNIQSLILNFLFFYYFFIFIRKKS